MRCLRCEMPHTDHSCTCHFQFAGFGFLFTYMRRYQHSALGYTFLLSALTIQWSILNVEFWHQVWDTVASGVDKFGKVVGASDGLGL